MRSVATLLVEIYEMYSSIKFLILESLLAIYELDLLELGAVGVSMRMNICHL